MTAAELEGLVTAAEGALLAELAAGVEAPLAIVEIGSYTGKSTCFLLEANQSAPVVAVDLWDLHLPGERKKGRRNKHKYEIKFNSAAALALFRERTNGAPNLTWIRGESAQVAKAWSEPIGLLFIDGGHDFASVKADFLGWAGNVVPGGWVAFHDATPGSRVMAVVERVVKPTGEWSDWRQAERMLVARRVA